MERERQRGKDLWNRWVLSLDWWPREWYSYSDVIDDMWERRWLPWWLWWGDAHGSSWGLCGSTPAAASSRPSHGVVWQSTLKQNRPGWSLDREYNIGGAYGLETSVGRCTRRQAWVRLEVDLMPSGGSLLTLVGARGHRSWSLGGQGPQPVGGEAVTQWVSE